ncbi:DNA topoisomerase 3-alpha [Nymphaea thermarum]|nr:DNA topoisomerase 3-alpha [Nymphaea thermarum]
MVGQTLNTTRVLITLGSVIFGPTSEVSGSPQCRNVVWLPGAIAEAHVSESICTTCTPGPVFKIQFKFRRMEIPPTFNVDHLGCIGGCDEILLELIETCGTGSRNPSAAPAQERRRVVPPTRNPPARNSRQVPCTHCRQVGHSASDCLAMVGGPPTASGSNLGGKTISRMVVLVEHLKIPTHQTVAKEITEPAEDEDGSKNEMLEEAL